MRTFLFKQAQEPRSLLAIRLYWGWQFATDGWGKLHHLDRVGLYFETLNLPMPHQTALFVSARRIRGRDSSRGWLWARRLVALVLFVNMTVAFWTVWKKDAFLGVHSNPDKFQGEGRLQLLVRRAADHDSGPGLSLRSIRRSHCASHRRPEWHILRYHRSNQFSNKDKRHSGKGESQVRSGPHAHCLPAHVAGRGRGRKTGASYRRANGQPRSHGSNHGADASPW